MVRKTVGSLSNKICSRKVTQKLADCSYCLRILCFICIVFFVNHLLKSNFCLIFASFNLVKHDACIVECVNDIFVGQIGAKGQIDFPIVTGNNIFINLKFGL